MSTIDFDARPDMTDEYAMMVRRFIPGYDALHDLTLVELADAGASGHALIVGAGGGLELVRFAAALPQWHFIGVDPSHQMLAQARERLAASGSLARVDLVAGVATDAPAGPFDAATALLALHFVPDDGQRLAQLQAIHARLRPGAPFVVANGSAAVGSTAFAATVRRYGAHAQLRGAPPDVIAKAAAMQSEIAIVPPEREEALLGEAGFRDIVPIFRALHIHAWAARA